MTPRSEFDETTGTYRLSVVFDGIEIVGTGRSPHAAEKICKLRMQEHERQQQVLRLNQKFLESERRASEQFAAYQERNAQ